MKVGNLPERKNLVWNVNVNVNVNVNGYMFCRAVLS